MSETLKILIVDDSFTYRMILRRVVKGIPDTEIVGMVDDGEQGLEEIRRIKPHVVLLDLLLPGIDGLEVLRRIRQRKLDTDVIMISGMSQDSADLTMKALDLGALDFIAKPAGASSSSSLQELTDSLIPLLNVSRQRLAPGKAKRALNVPSRQEVVEARRDAAAPPKAAPKAARLEQVQLLAVGCSTGGPGALKQLVATLPAHFPVPIVVVQHMPPAFTASLAQQLDAVAPIKVVEGREGMKLEPGKMIIAPGGYHMVIRGKPDQARVTLDLTPPVHNCRPAVDVMFQSVVKVFGGRLMGLLLTGMGQDGANGCGEIRGAGGHVLVQDEATSVVWGMPGTAASRGFANEILPLPKIGPRVLELLDVR